MSLAQKRGSAKRRFCVWSGLIGLLALALLSISCKKSSEDLCESACGHATDVVLGIVAAQGALNSQALQDRSVEMNQSCILECREGGIKPDCLLKASTYDALQECSTEAPPEQVEAAEEGRESEAGGTPAVETKPAEAGSEKLQDGIAPQSPESSTQKEAPESPSGP